MTRLDRTVQAIAEIAETRDDEFLLVEAAIDDRRVDDDVGMVPLDERDALGCGDDAHDAHAFGARAPEHIERRDRSSCACAIRPGRRDIRNTALPSS